MTRKSLVKLDVKLETSGFGEEGEKEDDEKVDGGNKNVERKKEEIIEVDVSSYRGEGICCRHTPPPLLPSHTPYKFFYDFLWVLLLQWISIFLYPLIDHLYSYPIPLQLWGIIIGKISKYPKESLIYSTFLFFH